ncbi:MAG: hypothetical protein ACRDY6_12635 [Acidimicrobiia bacterium]
MKRLATLILAACVLALAACAPVASEPPTPPKVVLWGDSFGESIAPHLPANFEVRAFGGTAPCDWLDDIRATVSRRPPEVAVLLFVGNTHTACTGGNTAGYAVDIAEATVLLRAAGSTVVIVAAPPFGGGPAPNPVNAAYEPDGADLVWGPSTSVAPGGVYSQAYRGSDGVHLNPAGAVRFAEALKKEVR